MGALRTRAISDLSHLTNPKQALGQNGCTSANLHKRRRRNERPASEGSFYSSLSSSSFTGRSRYSLRLARPLSNIAPASHGRIGIDRESSDDETTVFRCREGSDALLSGYDVRVSRFVGSCSLSGVGLYCVIRTSPSDKSPWRTIHATAADKLRRG